jgi:uncharacterized protein (DUF433 family)
LTAQDPRNTPSYRLNEAAHYLRIPKATLRSWLVGEGSFKPVIAIADRGRVLLSFINLIEVHILDAIRRRVGLHLERICWGSDGAPAKLFPFTRKRRSDDPKVIVIDPSLSFGRPVLVGTGIATAVIAGRFKAGESISALAKDYGRKVLAIEEAIRWELSDA